MTDKIKELYSIPLSINSIEIKNLNEATLRNVVIYDLNGDTVISAKRAMASIEPLKLIEEALHINTLTFESPEVRLSRTDNDVPLNIQFILDNLNKDNDKSNNTDLRINQLLIYDGSFSYDVMSERHITDRLDPNHIAIGDFSCNISLKNYNKESLNLYIRSVSGHEKSGLELNKVRARINAIGDAVILSGLRVELPGSNITSKNIEISGIGNSLQYVSAKGELSSEHFSFKDIAPIFPQFSQELPNVAFSLNGNINNRIAQGKISIVTDDNSLAFNGETNITTPYDNSREIAAVIDSLYLRKDAIEKITSFFENVPQEIADRLGDTDIKGNIFYSKDSIDCHTLLCCMNGNLNADINIDRSGNYTLTATGYGISVGNILNYHDLGQCDIRAHSIGNIHDNDNLAGFDVDIESLEFKEYTYSPIEIKGKAGSASINADILTSDPNISASASVLYNKDNKEEKISIVLNVDSLIPHRLKLSKDFKDITFSFRTECEHKITGKEKNLTNIKLWDFVYDDGEEKETVRNLYIYDDNTDEKRSITINSDILTADLVGKFNLADLHKSFLNMAKNHLPSLQTGERYNKADNNCFYRIEILDSRLFTKIFDLPFTINEKSTISGSCNDANNTFNIDAEINNVSFGGTQLRAINVKGESDKKDLVIDADVLMPMANEKKQFDYSNTGNDVLINLHSTFAKDTINNSISWGSIADGGNSNGSIQVDLALERDKKKQLGFKADIAPSSIILKGQEWNITPGRIFGHSDKFIVKDLKLYNKEQSLSIDGVAGKFIDDSLNIAIDNLDVATVMGLTGFRTLTFGGKATGKAHITSLLYNLDINGRFMVDSMLIDEGHMGDGDIAIGWMNYNKTLSLHGDIHRNGKISTVSGFLSKPQDTIMLKIDAHDLNVGFLHKKIDSFFSEAKGLANGTAYILGQWSKVNLVGAASLDSCTLRVKANNCAYHVNGDTLYMSPTGIYMNDVNIQDKHGNKGKLTGAIYHRNFSKWGCDINITANEMLVYDTYGFDSFPFYGTVFATGTANINTLGSGLTLKANLRSDANSSFIYNSTAASGARDNSFVTFTDSRKKSATDRPVLETKDNTYARVTSKINLDFMLDITEAFHIKVYTNLKTDDYIDFYGRGTVNALYDEKNGFSMKGGLNLDRGTYKFTIQDIFPKEFKIDRESTLAFDGDPFKAKLNLKTRYLVPSASLSDLTTETSKKKTVKVNCIMDIGGTLESPALSFDLELPEGSEEEKELLASVASTPEQKNMQFIYLLGVGKFYTFDYNNTGGDSQSSTAMESLISNTLSGQLNNMLSQIIDNDNWDISGNFSTSERGWNRMEVEGMLRGRLLNNRLLINGNLGYRENPVANNNFIGDFEILWLLNKQGNVNLKAYSKTNDRYFSKTNLTTQGAGILFKFDFSKWNWWKKDDEE